MNTRNLWRIGSMLLAIVACSLQLQMGAQEVPAEADTSIATRYEERIRRGQEILKARNNATMREAEALLREATYMEGIDGKARYEAVLLLGDALHHLQNPTGAFSSPLDHVYYDHWLDRGIEDYRNVLQSGDLAVPQQIELHRRIADLQLNKMEVAAANQTLADAVKIAQEAAAVLPETESDTTQTFNNLARFYQASAYARQLESDQAREIYDEVLQTGFSGFTGAQKNQLIIGRALLEETLEEQIALVVKYDKRVLPGLADHYGKLRAQADQQKGIQVHQWIVEDMETSVTVRFHAYSNWLNLLMKMDRYDEVQQVFAQYADSFQQLNNKLTRFLPFVWRGYWRATHIRSAEFMANPEFAIWMSETFADEEVPDNQKLTFYGYIINAANQHHDYEQVKLYARKIVDQVPDLKLAERLKWQMVIVVIEGKGNVESIVSTVHQVLQNEPGVDAKAYAEAILQAGQYAMWMDDYAVAERLLEERNKRVVAEPKRALRVRFLEDGPKDITGFLQSEYFRDIKNHGVLDRKYGDNLQYLMDTDTASTGRVMTTEGGEIISLDTGGSGGAGAGGHIAATTGRSDTHTSFIASCDEEQVYLFFYIPTEPEQAQKIREGAAGLGSFEITMAEGWSTPFTTLITGADGSISDDFSIAQYNNRNHRNKRVADGNVWVDHRVLENAVVMLFSFRWDAFVKLPNDGDNWFLEPIHWVKGGWTWGGSKSVHWLETAGELVFENLTVENRTAIQRRLLHRAKASFNRELSARENGYIEFWKDHQLGDQDFYAARVEEFHQRYADYAARIHADMTDEEVRTIFAEAYDGLINARFIVAQQRYQYVLRKHLQE